VINVEGGAVVSGHDRVLPWGAVDITRKLLTVDGIPGRAFLPGETYDDLSTMAWVLEPASQPEHLTLRGLAQWLNIDLPPFEDLIEGEPVPGGAMLADTVERLYRYLRLHLEQDGLWEVYSKVDRPVALLLRKMEQTGVPVVRGTIDLGAEKAETRKQWRGWPARWASLSGRVHPRWLQTTAVTGRITARDPSLQSLPRRLRHSVAAPPGRLIIAADLSGADFWAAAAMSGDPALLRMFEDGEDPYTVIGSGAGPDVHGRERDAGKRLALAALYGAAPRTLADDLYVAEGHVERALQKYRKMFPHLWAWRDGILDKFEREEELRNPFGRRLAPTIQAQAINHPAQSSVADLIKLAMIRLDKKLPSDAQLIAQIHDELLMECSTDKADKVTSLMLEEMTRPTAALPVRLNAKVGYGKSWAEATESQK